MELRYYCRQCNSPRPDATCWKCKSETIVPDPAWKNTKLPPVDRIRALAREVGYAIAVHGSQQRDLDLIAMPWVAAAATPAKLIEHLCKGLPCRQFDICEVKPHGRLAVNLAMEGWWKKIDLSIMPLQNSLNPSVKTTEELGIYEREQLAVRFFGYIPNLDINNPVSRMHIGKTLNRLHVPHKRTELSEEHLAFLRSISTGDLP